MIGCTPQELVCYIYLVPVDDPGHPPGHGLCSGPFHELAHELGRHARLVHMLKSQLSSIVPAGLDGACLGVLMALVRCGPRRQGELADVTFLDPSTVSRYVAQLVRAGLVTRQADPMDGRAVQLVATPSGLTLAREAAARRQAYVGEVLADWSPDDAQALVVLLRRLNDDIESHRDGNAAVRPA